jgi:p-cumate 2,3-dioxygenase beta subunit
VDLSALLLHRRVEDFLYREADLLDRWCLDDWFALFTEEAKYLVPPTDIAEEDADPDRSLYYVADDHARIRERVVRLSKKTAHSEFPRSKTRHLVTNVMAEIDGDLIRARASFAIYRSKDAVTDVFVGHYIYELVEAQDVLRIRSKTCVLDLESLRPHGRISILL